MPQDMTIGFVGLGHAGWPMAGLLAKAGYAVIAHDIDSEVEHAFAEENGCTPAGGIAGLANADVVVTMLPNGQVVRQVMLETDGGLAAHLAPGTVVIDTSSSDPYGTRELGAELAAHGIALVDAPVTRPEPGNDRLTIMVGGDEAAVDRAMPVIAAMAENVFRVGPIGAGHALKTLNNYVSAASISALFDALIVGNRFGLDVEQMIDVFNVGTAQNFTSFYMAKQHALSRRYESLYSLALLVKDLGIAARLSERVGFETSLPAYLRDQLGAALTDIGGDPDHTAALMYWEHRAGEQLPTLEVPAPAAK
jgi:3-hydroxyisobutyrate dehydrogenase-like beta-hydroxyacid dehydrogenase